MDPSDLGYSNEFEEYLKAHKLDSFGVGRVISEHRERYVVKTTENEYDAEILGNLRFTARSRADFPAVGDWVAISAYDDDKVLIHAVLPRKTVIERQTAGRQGEKQIIAANIDYAFIVQAADRDFNLNRMERYLAICNTAGVKPLILLSKSDLLSETDLNELLIRIKERVKGVPVVAISNETLNGFDELESLIIKSKTYCLLGSSGVGKSTLLNNLSGRPMMKTDEISTSTHKGRHVTSHRELIVLKNGGILIDNPGMREVGITDGSEGIELTFDEISQWAKNCKFKDCTHTGEAGCAVIAAVEIGEIDRGAYDNYLKLRKESEFFEATVAERRKKDKEFGKMVKNFKKDMKRR
jgi:ribosome biogenesis GTPase